MPDVFNSPQPPTNKAISDKPLRATFKHKESSENASTEHQLIDIPKDIHHMEGHTHNSLSSYCFYPDHVKFINSDPEERIILMLRKHPLTNVPWILTVLIMLIVPSFVTLLPLFENLPMGYQTLLILCWYLITFAFSLEKFLNWFFNVNLITDERIFDVDFHNLMYREITEADIDQIQDVTVEIGGGLRTLFGYGNVQIQTAAERPKIEFSAVPHPDQVAKVLRELGIQEEQEKIEGRIR